MRLSGCWATAGHVDAHSSERWIRLGYIAKAQLLLIDGLVADSCVEGQKYTRLEEPSHAHDVNLSCNNERSTNQIGLCIRRG